VIFFKSGKNPLAKILSKKRGEIMFTRSMWSKFFTFIFAVILIMGVSSMAGAASIKVGSLNDMTGATSERK